MNRLLGLRAYLCGPIDRCPEGGARWREWITPRLEAMGVLVIDPLAKPVSVGLEDDDSRGERRSWKRLLDWSGLRAVMKVVRAVDLRFVDVSDFLIVLLDMDIQMCGTWEEVFLANRQKKPILVWCPQGKAAIPDWMFGVIPHEHMFDDADSLLRYLEHVDRAPEVRTFGRWLFLDASKLYTNAFLSRIAERIAS